MDNVSALRIRIPIIPQEEEEEDDYFYEYEQEYDPFDDLENHYACLEYFEALRLARQQIHPDPYHAVMTLMSFLSGKTDPFYEHDMDVISPISFVDPDSDFWA